MTNIDPRTSETNKKFSEVAIKRDFLLEDAKGKNDIHVYLFPDEQYLVLKMGDKEARINKDALWGVAFAISEESKQVDLIPVKKRSVRTFFKKVVLEAKKPIPKGGRMVANVKFTVPIEALAEAKMTKSGLLVANY